MSNGPDAAHKENHLVCSTFANCSNCMARTVALYFMNSHSLQLLV